MNEQDKTGVTTGVETSERESQLSALYDGELPEVERELVARRLSRDENLRRSWENYALIGAVMRRESLAGDRLAARVAAQIAAAGVTPDATTTAAETATGFDVSTGNSGNPKELPPRMPRWAVPASGLGLAAGIAVVGVFGVLWLGTTAREPVSTASMLPPVTSKVAEVVIPAAPSGESTTVVDASPALLAENSATAADAKGNGEPLSYVTPPLKQGTDATVAFSLAGYVGAHSAVSAPMLRHSAISAVIAVDAQQPAEVASSAESVEPAR